MEYGGLGIVPYSYRFTYSGDTLTIDKYSYGGSNGISQMSVTQIFGLI